MEGHWESVKDKLDRSFYKSPRIGYRTREQFGPALDDFNTELEELDAKKAEVYRVINNIPDQELREKFLNNMTMSIASTYDKLKGAVVHERGLLYSNKISNSATYDSFLTTPEVVPAPKLSSKAPTKSVLEQEHYLEALKLIERCQGKNG